MNRLTKDLNTPHDDTTYANVVIDVVDRENIVLTELKYYEDIKEELGIDLITLFKALKQGGVYVKEGNKVDWGLMMKGFEIVGDGNEISLWSQVKLEPKDYGKTWALTREEIENE